VAVALLMELPVRDRTKLGVNEWDEPVPHARIIAATQGHQLVGDLVLRIH
jgi:hypothetical protein